MLSILEAWSDGDRSILTLRKFYSIPNYVMLRTLPAGSLPTARISLDLSSCYSDAERAIKDAAGRNDIDAKSRDTAQALYCVARSTHALRDEMFPSSLGDGEDMQDLKFFLSFKGNPFHRLGILTNQFNSDPYKERYYSSDVLNNTAILRKEVLTSLYIALESLTAWPWDRSLVPGKVVVRRICRAVILLYSSDLFRIRQLSSLQSARMPACIIPTSAATYHSSLVVFASKFLNPVLLRRRWNTHFDIRCQPYRQMSSKSSRAGREGKIPLRHRRRTRA